MTLTLLLTQLMIPTHFYLTLKRNLTLILPDTAADPQPDLDLTLKLTLRLILTLTLYTAPYTHNDTDSYYNAQFDGDRYIKSDPELHHGLTLTSLPSS